VCMREELCNIINMGRRDIGPITALNYCINTLRASIWSISGSVRPIIYREHPPRGSPNVLLRYPLSQQAASFSFIFNGLHRDPV
jgi:hypothetical protein